MMARAALIYCTIWIIQLCNSESIYYFANDAWNPISSGANDTFSSGYVMSMESGPFASDTLLIGGSFDLLSAQYVQNNVASVSTDPGRIGWIYSPSFPGAYGHRASGLNIVQTNRTGSDQDFNVFVGGLFSVDCASSVPCVNFAFYPSVAGQAQMLLPIFPAPLGEVLTLAILRDYVFVGGTFRLQVPGFPDLYNFAVWNNANSSWLPWLSVVPNAPSWATHLHTTSSGRVYCADKLEAGTVIKFTDDSGLSWHTIADSLITGSTANILTMEHSQDGDVLYIGGKFNSIGGNSSFTSMARYSASQDRWSPIGPGVVFGTFVLPYICCLKMMANGTTLLVSGLFYEFANSDVQANSVLSYDVLTNQYMPLSSGFYGIVKTITETNGTIFAGIWEFTSIPGSSMAYAALVGAGAFLLVLLFLLSVYFMVCRFRVPESPRHKAIHARLIPLSTSLVMLMTLATVQSQSSEIGATFFLAQIFPGLSVIAAEQLAITGNTVAIVLAAVVAPVAGWLSIRVNAKWMGTAGLLLGMSFHLAFALGPNPSAILFSYVCNGLSVGLVFATAVNYYARTAKFTFVVGSMIALYSTVVALSSFLDAISLVSLQIGLLKPDFVSHGIFEVILQAVLIVLLHSSAFHDLAETKPLTLKQQFAVDKTSAVILIVAFFFVWSAEHVLNAMIGVFFHTHVLQMAQGFADFGTTLVLLGVFYYLTYRGVSLRRAAVVVLCILTLGFLLLIISLFTLPANQVVLLSWQLFTFFLGSVIVPSCLNVLFAMITSVFITILPPTSKGTWIGFFVGAGIIAELVGLGIAAKLVEGPHTSGAVAAIMGAFVLFLIFLFVWFYKKFVPQLSTPFFVTDVKVEAQELQERLLPRPVEISTPANTITTTRALGLHSDVTDAPKVVLIVPHVTVQDAVRRPLQAEGLKSALNDLD
eukprot:TRINITY_DN5699_c0_g1_i1.p1 TRINITY_DN5699_c0_g1~~TRINITY_DN5699_c0_g1_i1.p1  ORF type:complete len:928 (-),score=86.52 TRINITY_DN5699_c0_g1_i1:1214-3997(-)